jgi:hypothetical protein
LLTVLWIGIRFHAYPDSTFNLNCSRPDHDLTPSFTQVGKSDKFLTFIHRSVVIHYFIFFFSALGDEIFNISLQKEMGGKVG